MTGRHLSILFSRPAARQIERANEWWRAHRTGSPEALTEELNRVLELVSRQPGVGARADAQQLGGVRRVLLPRVGYLLFYRVAARKEELQVLAFWHARRGSRPRF